MYTRLLVIFLLLPPGAFLQPNQRVRPLQPDLILQPDLRLQPAQPVLPIQPADPWTPAQLMEPADLAARIKNGTAPLLICVGPSGLIKGSVETGPAHEAAHYDSLKALLAREDRNREVVIYCGCCPFVHCPNVRPAFSLLLSMHFTHARLLDLSHNIRTDWIDHGYPVKEDAAHAK